LQKVIIISKEENNVSNGKLGRKRPLWRPHHRWERTVNMHTKEEYLSHVDWIPLVLDRDQC
jgi:hypothetical protein